MYDNLLRQTLLLLVGAYCFAKEIVKNICFFLKIGNKIIINKTQMYIGTFLSLKKIFIIGKKVFSLGLIAWIDFVITLLISLQDLLFSEGHQIVFDVSYIYSFALFSF